MTMKIVDVDDSIIKKLRESGLSKEMKSLEFCKFLVIEEKDGKMIGAGGMGGLFNIPSLQISKELQGKGIGKILLDTTIKEAKRRGFSYISGSRNPENTRAIKLHDYFGFKIVFRAHYNSEMVRDVIILVLRPRGKIIGRILRIFNTIIGNILLAILLKIGKSLFPVFLTYPPEEFPDVDILHMIKNFEKLD